MQRYLVCAFVSLGFAAGSAVAQETPPPERPEDQSYGEIALSEEAVQLRYVDDADRMAEGRFGAGFFLSEERDIVLTGDILFSGDLWSDRFQINFGPRAYAALLEDENDDVLAATLGAQMRFAIHPESGFAVAGEAFYAPDILTFGSADSLTDLSARLEVRLQQRLTLFGGMRWFEFDLIDDGGVRTLQEEVFVGVGWRFY